MMIRCAYSYFFLIFSLVLYLVNPFWTRDVYCYTYTCHRTLAGENRFQMNFPMDHRGKLSAENTVRYKFSHTIFMNWRIHVWKKSIYAFSFETSTQEYFHLAFLQWTTNVHERQFFVKTKGAVCLHLLRAILIKISFHERNLLVQTSYLKR